MVTEGKLVENIQAEPPTARSVLTFTVSRRDSEQAQTSRQLRKTSKKAKHERKETVNAG